MTACFRTSVKKAKQINMNSVPIIGAISRLKGCAFQNTAGAYKQGILCQKRKFRKAASVASANYI